MGFLEAGEAGGAEIVELVQVSEVKSHKDGNSIVGTGAHRRIL
jgi:hypothetical protein